MTEAQYLIHDLAQRAGTSVRTIRYYTDEGLLPPPVIQGKYAFYTEAHLKRLALIRRMKETYLPLREIREIINSLSDEEVNRRLLDPPIFDSKIAISDQSPGQTGAHALQYISRLVDEQAAHRSEEGGNIPRRIPSNNRVSEDASPVEYSTPAPASEKWVHIAIVPGVELHLREPVDPDTSDLIHELVDFAHRLFNTKKVRRKRND